MQTRYGGEKPAQNPVNACDYLTGLGMCYGVALALLHRKRTGEGQYVNSALIYGATMLNSRLLQSYEGKKWDDPGGLDCRGEHPLYRMYQASDAWLFIATSKEDLSRCPALADIATLADVDLERALEARLRERRVDEWVKVLRDAGIAAQPVVLNLSALMDDPVVLRQGLSLTRPHEGQGVVTTTGPGIRFSRTPMAPGRPAPMPGTDAESILAEIGLAGELKRLVAQGVVVTGGVQPGGAS
jgi:crotonobetainyl-CoA:carnitine CoA-transferase CaiB-like acyl-CoA transferase